MNILGHVHSVRNVDAQEAQAANFAAAIDDPIVVDKKTIVEFVEEAGLGDEYIDDLEVQLATKVDTVARLDFYDRMGRLQKIFSDNVETGLGFRDWVKSVGQKDLMGQLGLSGKKPYYLETVYRTNYTSAHTAGRWRSAQNDPNVTMLEFVGVNDNRQTEHICAPLNGVIKPKDDALWRTATPPNHFACRSTLVELTESMIEIDEIKEKGPSGDVDIPKDFRENSAENNGWMKPTKGMTKRLADFEVKNK